jgi:hypothetical protein
MRGLILTLPLLVVATAAPAADRFVAPRGADTGNDCSSAAAPCASLAHALGQAGSGDTIKLAIGTYRTNAVIDFPTTLTISGGWSQGFTKQDGPRATPRTRLDGKKLGRVLSILADAESIDVTLDRVTVTRGNAGSELPRVGGGVRAVSRNGGQLALTVRNSAFKANQQGGFDVDDYGGGLGIAGGGGGSITALVEDSSFSSNRSNSGGAVGLLGGAGDELTLRRVVVRSNDARFLGAITVLGGTVVIDDSVVETNRYREGAITLDSATATIVNSVVRRNPGWGIVVRTSDVGSVELVNSVVTGNVGIGVKVQGGTVTIRNSILWDNRGNDLEVWGFNAAPVANLDHSDIGPTLRTPPSVVVNDLGGNVSVDPQLARPGGRDVHLKPGSPLIDAGTCTGAPPTDFDGDPRPGGATCDVGADEVVP